MTITQGSQSDLAFIARKEAMVLAPYPDSVSWAQGLGINDPALNANSPNISIEDGCRQFVAKLAGFECTIVKLFDGVALFQHEFGSLLSVEWNIGPGNKPDGTEGLAHERSLLAVAKYWVASGRPPALAGTVKSAFELAGYSPSAGPKNPGRRDQEADLFLNANYGDISKLQVFRTNPKVVPKPDPDWVPMPVFRLAA